MNKTSLGLLVALFFLQNCICHAADVNLEGRIVGGQNISARWVPYIVQLLRRASTKSAYSQTCAGTLLDERTVLTAAHCVYNRPEENFLVLGGTDMRAGMDGLVTRIEKIVVHELYNASISDNDIALAFLSPPLPIEKYDKMNVISLGTQKPNAGAMVTVSGWGNTQENGHSAAKLQQVQIPVVNATECQEVYNWRPISDAMLCAGLPEGGKDACQGDSGGPLVFNNQLVGIVSWGEGCARSKYPGVYTNVAHFNEWIELKRK